jgi:predicted nucleic acid-binding protein
MILVDTPVWSLALRRRIPDLAPAELQLVQLLQQIIREGRAQLLGAVRQELLSGIRDSAQFRKIRDYLRSFPDVETSSNDYEEAARASNQCRAAGIAASPADMLICALAIRHGWEVLTADLDFARYSVVLQVRLVRQ